MEGAIELRTERVESAVILHLEGRLFSDDRVFWERVAIAEDELVDECAGGALDGEEQALFDANLLVTAERRPHSLPDWLRVPAGRAAGVR